MYLYVAVGIVLMAFWFWQERTGDKGERCDIAIAFPVMVLL
jgi:hypothetical protein